MYTLFIFIYSCYIITFFTHLGKYFICSICFSKTQENIINQNNLVDKKTVAVNIDTQQTRTDKDSPNSGENH